MGSHSVSHRVPKDVKTESELRKYWDRYMEQDRYENGTDPYSGTFSTTRGLIVKTQVFESEAKADEYILERTQKWEAAMAVRVKVVEVDYRLIEADEKLKALKEEQHQAERAEMLALGEVRSGMCKGAATRACRNCGSKIAMRWTEADSKAYAFRDGTCPVCKKGSLFLKGEQVILTRARNVTLKAQEKTADRKKALHDKLAAKQAASEFWYVAGWAAC